MHVGTGIAIVMMLVDVDVQLRLGVEELLPGRVWQLAVVDVERSELGRIGQRFK